MDIGTNLREARERRGLTLHEVADATKLSMLVLRRMERNQLHLLPGGIFTKGCLRAYAAEVGLDPEAIVRAYLAQYPPTEEMPVFRKPAVEPPHASRNLVTTGLVVAVASLAYVALHDSTDSPAPRLPDRIQVTAPADPFPGEGVVPAALPARQPEEPGQFVPEARSLYIDVQPTGRCWVSAVADGQQVVYRLLEAGDRVTLNAREELVLRVGDPETFAYTLNGEWGRSLGDAGKPVTVTLTPGNFRSFLESAEPPRDAPATVT